MFLSPKAAVMTHALAVTLALFGTMAPLTIAQEAAVRTEAMLTLPDSPGVVMASSSSIVNDGSTSADASFDPQSKAPLPMARPTVKFISAGQAAPPQRAGDKVLLGLRASARPFTPLAWLTSAGYTHLTNSSPNYGTNGEAFAQRFGAAAALNVSKEIFSDSVMAPILHQDPRYYKLGRSQGFFKRSIYSVTRPVIGRTDGGHTIPNFAYLSGTAGAAALTKAYYPPRNQSAGEVFQTFGTTLGGTAIGYLVNEFSDDIFQFLHLKKRE